MEFLSQVAEPEPDVRTDVLRVLSFSYIRRMARLSTGLVVPKFRDIPIESIGMCRHHSSTPRHISSEAMHHWPLW
eukprot:1642029-Amphidinium_carterae.1